MLLKTVIESGRNALVLMGQSSVSVSKRAAVCSKLLAFADELLGLVQAQRRHYVLHLQGKLWVDYGAIAEADGDSDLAVERYKRSLAILEGIAAEGGDQVLPQTLGMIGDALSKGGKFTEAFPYFDRAVAILVSRLGESHPDVAKFSFLAGQAHLAGNDPRAALALLTRSRAAFRRAREDAARLGGGGGGGAGQRGLEADLAHCDKLIGMAEARLGLAPGSGSAAGGAGDGGKSKANKAKKSKKKSKKAKEEL